MKSPVVWVVEQKFTKGTAWRATCSRSTRKEALEFARFLRELDIEKQFRYRVRAYARREPKP